MSKLRRRSRFWLFLLLAALAITNENLYAGQQHEPITIEDLAERVQIPLISLAPDGCQVAYLTVRGLPLQNLYEVTLNLQPTDGKTQPLVLDQYRLAPDVVFEKDTGSIQKIAGQFVWSPDGTELAYSTHLGSHMEVRVRTVSKGSEKLLINGFDTIEISSKNGHLGLTTTSALSVGTNGRIQPEDFALLVQDGYRFYGPLSNPKTHGKFIVQHWEYLWHASSPVKANEADVVSYFGFPEEWIEPKYSKTADSRTLTRYETASPNGALVAIVENSTKNLSHPLFSYRASQIVVKDLKHQEREQRVLVPSTRPRAVLTILGWSIDGNELYYLSADARFSSVSAVTLDGTVREIHKEQSGFSLPNPSSEISEDRRALVLVRTTNVVPDELVKLDLKTGALTVVASPNDVFRSKVQPKVRFVPIECCDADFHGRLYLPSDYAQGKRYPLVFTNYVSGPGFDASVGDEVPIEALVAHGIAVFAMNSREANNVSTTGDFRSEISRVERPLRAMEWVQRKLVEEGIIAPGQCGLTGLSYGTEIAMYAYWKSKIFRAVSVATATWEPTAYILGGIPYAKYLDSRGFTLPDDGSYVKWKELSAGLNARPDLPPLLVQSPDGEEYSTVETWFRLRRIGAPVEWYEYPGEGHVKRGSANRWWVYQRNLDWFRFWLKGEEDPDPAKAEQYARWRALRKLQEENQKSQTELASH